MKIDQKTKTWIQQQLAQLEASEDYSPMVPGVDAMVENWEEYNPKMCAALKKERLLRPMAQVYQAKMWEDREELELSGLPPTDAREQAEKNWYLEPEQTQPSL